MPGEQGEMKHAWVPNGYPLSKSSWHPVTSCFPLRSSTCPGRASPRGTSRPHTDETPERTPHLLPQSPSICQDFKAAVVAMPLYKFNAILEELGADSQTQLTPGSVSLPQKRKSQDVAGFCPCSDRQQHPGSGSERRLSAQGVEKNLIWRPGAGPQGDGDRGCRQHTAQEEAL